MAGVVSVGDIDKFGDDPAAGSIAFARPKSRTFTVPVGAHFDIRRLRIAVDDPLLVRATWPGGHTDQGSIEYLQ